MTHRLQFGALDLDDDTGPYRAYAEGVDFGGPVALTTALDRLLLDGEMVTGSRSGNRELRFLIGIVGGDPLEMADAEAALVAEVNKRRNTITWTPPGGFGIASVFDTFRGSLRHRFDDLAELEGERFYELTLPALPFARSVDLITETTTASASSTGTVVDAADATTNWTSNGTLATTTAGGRTYLAATHADSGASGGGWRTYVQRNAVTYSQYMAVDLLLPSTYGTVQFQNFVSGSGSTILSIVRTEALPGGWTRYYVDTSSITTGAFYISLDPTGLPASPAPVTGVDALTSYVSLPSDLPKQSVRSLEVRGSMRTPGSVTVSHATDALGTAIVYTHADLENGYRPDLRRWRTSGQTVTTDAAMVSGAREPLSNSLGTLPFTASVPAATLKPGAYALVALVKTDVTNVVLDATAQNGTSGPSQSASTRLVNGTGGVYKPVHVGVFHLPPTGLAPESKADVTIKIAASNTTSIIDEAWLFSLDGALTIVESTGKNLWIESPSVDFPQGAVFTGAKADRTDAVSAAPTIMAFSDHLLEPPRTLMFVVTSGTATNATVALSHYPRWHTNAAL